MHHSLRVSVLASAALFWGGAAFAQTKPAPPPAKPTAPAEKPAAPPAPAGPAAKVAAQPTPPVPPAGSFDATDCKACHEPAVTKMEQTKHGTLAESCATCHDRDQAIRHSKDRAEGTETPGPSVKAWSAKQVNTLCLGCHEKGNQANWAGGVHERRQVSCISCHSIHSFKSVKAQLKTAADPETCYTCHKTQRAQSNRQSHHPVKEGKLSCASCHNPHDGSRPKMLQAESTNELCYKCHAEKRGPFLFEHAPVREDCTSCHAPHGSNHKRLLAQKLPNLCWNCHLTGSGHFGSGDNFSTENGVRVAPPGAPSGYPTVNNRFTEKACKNCHANLHGSNSPSGAFFLR